MRKKESVQNRFPGQKAICIEVVPGLYNGISESNLGSNTEMKIAFLVRLAFVELKIS